MQQNNPASCDQLKCKIMALPTLSTRVPTRSTSLGSHMAWQREREAERRRQWENHARYLSQESVRSQRQAVWSSAQSFNKSMSAYRRQHVKEEHRASLEQRRNRLRTLLLEERTGLEAELRELVPDRKTLTGQLLRRREELRTAREERRKKLAEELLREHWKKNNPQLREVEAELHKDHVVSQWQKQIVEKKQRQESEREEKRRLENEYARAREEALERMRRAEEKRKADERQRTEGLLRQMEELRLREEEGARLKEEQEALLLKQWQLEKVEEERKQAEQRQKKFEMRRFLVRQYRAQMRRRAEQVQEELEAERKMLAALLDGEEEEERAKSSRRERAVADVAWMKRVIEEQLQLEREREAEIDFLHRQEAQRVWEEQEAQWEKERNARERLMQEVLAERQQQLTTKMENNREARAESQRRREELIKELEAERDLRRKEKGQQESRRAAWVQEIDAQVEQRRREQLEEQHRTEREEEEEEEVVQGEEEELRLEMQRMKERGHQEKIHSRPRSAWT